MAIRDILLARRTGGHIHLCHMSTRGSVELIRWGKDRHDQRDGRSLPASHLAHRGCGRGLRHERQDESAAAHGGRRRRAAAGGARRHDRSHRHRPRAASLRREGARVRRRAERDHRAGDGARGEHHLAGRAGDHRPVRHSSSACRARRRACSSCPAARCAAAHRPTSPCSIRTRQWVVEPKRFNSKGRNTPYAGQTLQGARAMSRSLDGRVVQRSNA